MHLFVYLPLKVNDCALAVRTGADYVFWKTLVR